MEREGETNLSAVVEGFIDCGVRDTCDRCPYYEKPPIEENARGKVGVRKRTDE
jgi:hypothetical protein